MARGLSACPWFVTRIGFLIFAVVGNGCTATPVRPTLPLDSETTNMVLQALHQRESDIEAIKGLFYASITGSILPISQNLNGVLFYRRPHTIQLKGFTRVGGVIFEFLRDTDHYQLHLPSAGKFVSGRVSELNKAGEFRQVVELSLRAMDAILGEIAGLDGGDVAFYDDGERIRVEVPPEGSGEVPSADAFITRVWVSKNTFDVVQVEYFIEDEEVAMTVECSDFRVVKQDSERTTSSIRLPFHIRAEDFRSSGGSMTLIFQEMVANADSSPLSSKHEKTLKPKPVASVLLE